MGTRHLTVVVSKGEVKVAQYGQWDGYPTGQGKTIAKFLQNKLDLPKLKANVDALKWAEFEYIKDCWTKAGANPDEDFVTMDVSYKFREMYPQFSRDTGAEIIELIQNGSIVYRRFNGFDVKPEYTEMVIGTPVDCVQNDYNFAAESLFCEYVYVIDLDNEQVEFYVGYNTDKNADFGRFEELIELRDKTVAGSGREYYPVALHSIIPFSEFTVELMDALEKDIREEDEEAV